MGDSKNLVTDEIVSKYLEFNRNGRATARALDIPKSTVQGHINKAKKDPRYKELFEISEKYEVSEIDILQQQISELRKELNRAKKDNISSESVKKYIYELKDEEPVFPKWISEIDKSKKSIVGVPSVALSDFHFGEVVDSNQIMGTNEYNLGIAKERLNRVTHTTIDLFKNHIVNDEYPGIVVNLLGDLLSGSIHDELLISNEKEVLQVHLELYGALIKCLTDFADAFGKVFVPCVPGNHSRLTKKPKAKNYAYDSMDWHICVLLAKYFEKDDRFKFLISDGEDIQYKIYDWTYRATHGSQYRGGDSIIGCLGPVIRGNMKKQSTSRSMGTGYDILLLGHFHQLMFLQNRIIINGSLVGYNEYAFKGNFPYEVPQQAAWITHPELGITFPMPVVAERNHKKYKDSEWISWKE